MRLTNLKLGGENAQPEVITVEMTVTEAIVIGMLVGKQPSPSPEVSSIYNALIGDVFNRFWEDGIEGAARGDAA